MLALTVLTWQALSLSMGPVRHRAASPIRHGAISACDGSDDLNFLQTKLHRAVADEHRQGPVAARCRTMNNNPPPKRGGGLGTAYMWAA